MADYKVGLLGIAHITMQGEILFLFLHLLAIVSGNEKSTMQVGDSLSVHDFLLSSGHTFAFGFINVSAVPPKFRVGIKFFSIGTVVWTAATEQVTSLAQLRLTPEGLIVFDNGKPQALFSCTAQNLSATMQENGNFVLRGNNANDVVWQTFPLPTHTLLAGQVLADTQTLDSESGSYKLYLNSNSVGLKSSAVPESNSLSYWDVQRQPLKGEAAYNLSMNSSGIVRFADNVGPWYYSWDENSYIYALDFDAPNSTRRLTLELDGNLRIYSLAKDNSSWNIAWQAMFEECRIFGVCGAFGVCTYRPQLTCTCPPGFHFVDAENPFEGCEYNVPLQQHCNGSEITWLRLDRTDYSYNDLNFSSKERVSLEECKASCARDCKCLAAVYKIDGSGHCFRKGSNSEKQVIYNGFQLASVDTVTFLKVSPLDASLPSEGPLDQLFVSNVDATNKVKTRVLKKLHFPRKLMFAVVFASAELLVITIVGILSCLYVSKAMKRLTRALEVDGAVTRFTYHQLEVATNYFREMLGAGGFGTVYKGVLPNGTLVAVKNIEMAAQAQKQFQAEVATLGKIHHVNLVRLLGYCAEGSHRLLVYEFMSNGSLENVLFSSDESKTPASGYLCEWKTRFSIALGIARGITYLHEECQECILHCDIKPENILLDDNFCPKVSDFGLAKLVKRESSANITTVRGTRGYMAPEWVHNVTINAKADVYSFGMVLLEIMSGREKFPFAASSGHGRSDFRVWAFQRYVGGDIKAIADLTITDNVDWQEFEMVLRVAFWCIQPEAELRPSMNKVLQMLENSVPVPEPPFPRLLESHDEGNDSSGR